MKKLFTERHGAMKPRVAETLDAVTRDALLNLVRARMDEEWFGLHFPEKCRDGHAFAGTDFSKLQATMDGYGVLWPRTAVDPDAPPTDGQVFDLVEFAYEHVAEALNPEFHSYWSHSHYTYDQRQGQAKFADGPLSQTSCRFPDLHGSTTTHEPKPTLQRIPRPSAEQGQTARPA